VGPATLSPPRTPLRWPLVAAGCVALSVLSLLAARQTTYDPTAWLIWGREIVRGDLSTTAGPSWKPLPVLVTAPASLLGDDAAQQLWLVVARAGGLAALVLAFDLARRLGGVVAGVIAAGALLVAGAFATHVFRGDSEGLLAAFGLGAVAAHLAGRRWLAFALVVATALLRPEMLLFVVGYGAWLAWHDRRAVPVVAGAVVLIVCAWLIPEEIGSGELLRAASRAREPVTDSPAQAAFPFLATFTNAAPVVPWPVYVGGVAFVLAELRRRRLSLALVLAAIATILMIVVAAMAQIGFTGNARYLTIPIALTCVLGGAGWAMLYRMARARLSPAQTGWAVALAVAVAAPFVVADALRLRDEMHDAFNESAYFAALPDAIAHAGGRAAVLRCPTVYAAPFDTQAVAWALHVHQNQVGISGRPPGTIVARRGSALANDRRYRPFASTSRWIFATTC
jgi:uncharacterized protein (DUF934 family)